MMKIGIIVGDYPPYARGTGTTAYAIASHLQKNPNFQIIVFTRRKTLSIDDRAIFSKNEQYDRFETYHNVSVVRFGIPMIPLVQIWHFKKKISRFTQQSPIDLAIVVTPGVYCIPKGIPFILYNGGSIRIYEQFRKLDSLYSAYIKVFSRILANFEKRLALGARKIISVSHIENRIFAKEYKISTNKMSVIHNGISLIQDSERWRSNKNALLLNSHDKKSHQKDLNLGFIGELNFTKGISVLVNAFLRMSKINTNVKLVIVGNGPEYTELRRMSEKAHMKNNIFFMGYIPPNNLPRVYKHLDVLIVPSNHDACPNTVLEAFSYGIPVIGSKAGGIPELVTQETGFLFPRGDINALANIMEKICQNPEILVEKHSAILKMQKSLLWEEKIRKLEQILDDLFK